MAPAPWCRPLHPPDRDRAESPAIRALSPSKAHRDRDQGRTRGACSLPVWIVPVGEPSQPARVSVSPCGCHTDRFIQRVKCDRRHPAPRQAVGGRSATGWVRDGDQDEHGGESPPPARSLIGLAIRSHNQAPRRCSTCHSTRSPAGPSGRSRGCMRPGMRLFQQALRLRDARCLHRGFPQVGFLGVPERSRVRSDSCRESSPRASPIWSRGLARRRRSAKRSWSESPLRRARATLPAARTSSRRFATSSESQ